MELGLLDSGTFAGYVLVVVAWAMWSSRRRQAADDFFLAGRRLPWGLIGLSLVASSVAVDHFLRVRGRGYTATLAQLGYEWIGAVAMVLAALLLLPRFLRRGVTTIPEYLEARYSAAARGLMALALLAVYVLAIIPAVLFTAATWVHQSLGLAPGAAIWAIGLVVGLYTIWGGLRAVVWVGLSNGLALLLAGTAVAALGFLALGGGQGLLPGVRVFFEQAGDALEVVKPLGHRELPWAGVLVGGLWVLQIFGWGIHQGSVQRTLGARSVADGQKGLLLGATLKLLLPVAVVVPTMVAFHGFADGLRQPHEAYPQIVYGIAPVGLRGLVLAAMFGALVSALDALLHSASTLLAVDVYQRYVRPGVPQAALVGVARAAIAAFVVFACLAAPQLGRLAGDWGVFAMVEHALGLVAPGIVAAVLVGMVSPRTPSQAAIGAMLLGPAFSVSFAMWCLKIDSHVAVLHQMAFAFLFSAAYMLVVTLVAPLREEEAAPGSECAVPSERPTGRRRRTLIPFATMILGGFLLGQGLFLGSYITLYQLADRYGWVTIPDLVHLVNAGVPTAIYFALGLWLMRSHAPSARRGRGPKPAPRRAKPGPDTWARRAAALLAAAVAGLHVYMFCLWVIPEWPPRDYWQGYDVNLSAVGTGQPVITVKPLDDEMGGPPAPPPGAAGDRVVTVYLTPLVIGIVAAVALLVGLAMLGRIPAAPGIAPEPMAKLDPAPSRWAPWWAAAIVACVVVLYWLIL